MSFPVVKCAICGKDGSKRSTILIEPYGRICRSHPEVEQHQVKLAEIAVKAAEDKQFAKAMQNMQVISIASGIRMMAYMNGASLELALLAFAWKLPKEIRSEVEKQVRERGPITEDEFTSALAMTTLLAKKTIDYSQT
jgi:hypothetical protein